jgi:hypothetical protein
VNGSEYASDPFVYTQEIVQCTMNSIHMELRQTPVKAHRKAEKVLTGAAAVDRLKSKGGAVSIKVVENLTPIDTKRSRREATRVR